MKKYVVVFLFDKQFENVWLIEKQKPEWQKGCLNGIGGKIEEGEFPLQAAYRELEEESGVSSLNVAITQTGSMSGINNDGSSFEVYVFSGKTHHELVSKEEEKVSLYPLSGVKDLKHIENVPALIELCLYHELGESHFGGFTLDYSGPKKDISVEEILDVVKSIKMPEKKVIVLSPLALKYMSESIKQKPMNPFFDGSCTTHTLNGVDVYCSFKLHDISFKPMTEKEYFEAVEKGEI